DWIVKLIDVYPDPYIREREMSGYQLMVANDVFRGRYRNSFEKPQPLQPGKINEFTVDLHSVDHVFQKGHRIMLQIQSTWFPIIDRNPQKYISNIFEAGDSDFKKASHKIFRTPGNATYIDM